MAERRIPYLVWLGTAASLLCLIALSLALAPTAAATHRGEGVVDQVQLRVAYRGSPAATARGQIVANMAMDDGEPIVGETVQFSRQVDFLGSRVIQIGSAATDANGDARIMIDQHSGPMTVLARFEGDEHYLAAERTLEISAARDAAASAAVPAAPSSSLAVIKDVMPGLLVVTSVGVWVLLFGLLAGAVFAIRRARSTGQVDVVEE